MTVHEYATDARVMARGQLNYLEKYKVDGLVPMSDVAAYASAFGTTTKFFDTIEDTPVFDKFAVKKSDEWKDIEVIDPFKDGRIPV